MLKELKGMVGYEVRKERVLHQHCLIEGKGWQVVQYENMGEFIQEEDSQTFLNSYTHALWIKILGVRMTLKQNTHFGNPAGFQILDAA